MIITLSMVGGVTSCVAYLSHRGLKKLQTADIVFQMQPEEIKLSPRMLHKLTELGTRITPYSGFCEISGCKHEIHANKPHLFEMAMSNHLSKDH